MAATTKNGSGWFPVHRRRAQFGLLSVFLAMTAIAVLAGAWRSAPDAWTYLIIHGWLFAIPAIIFAGYPSESKWFSASRFLIALIVGYLLLNLGVLVSLELRFQNATSEAERWQLSLRDGGHHALSVFFGWIPVSVYAAA